MRRVAQRASIPNPGRRSHPMTFQPRAWFGLRSIAAGCARVALMASLVAGCVSAESPGCLVVVVHPANTAPSISREGLRRLLLGEDKTWANRERVTVVQREAGSRVERRVLSEILKMTEAEYARWLAGASFRGEEPPRIKVLTSPDGALKFVSNVPGAFTVIDEPPPPGMDSLTKVLRVEGKLPREAGYPFP